MFIPYLFKTIKLMRPSKLSSNAEAIFKALNISLERNVKNHVVAKF